MADTMQFDLVSPERRLASMQVQAVLVPGADGDLTAMADHAPLITTPVSYTHLTLLTIYSV